MLVVGTLPFDRRRMADVAVGPLMENPDCCCRCGVAELGSNWSRYWSSGSAAAFPPEPPTLTGSWVKANAGLASPIGDGGDRR
ncbi:MAG: hypothetical protein U1E38_02705 [Rhodospirillales bacterium]